MSTIVSEIREFIAQANGFENHYKHRYFRGYSYSDGIKFIAEKAGAYWLIDAIFSHSKEKRLQEGCDGMEWWNLKRDETGNGAVLTCTDGGLEGGEPQVVASQRIEYTDFPLAEIELLLDNGILLLPSER